MYKIVLEVKGEKTELKSLVKKFGGNVHKNKAVLPLNVIDDNKLDLEKYPKGRIVVDVWESGGMEENGNSKAQVVCSMTGQPLPPIFIRDRGDLINLNHAYFNVPVGMGCVILTGEKESLDSPGDYTFTSIQYGRKRGTTVFLDVHIEQFSSLPNGLSTYKKAYAELNNKMNDVNCVETFFVKR